MFKRSNDTNECGQAAKWLEEHEKEAARVRALAVRRQQEDTKAKKKEEEEEQQRVEEERLVKEVGVEEWIK